MIIIVFLVILLITVTLTNKKNEAAATDQNLEFEQKDSLLIFAMLILSIILHNILKNFFPKAYLIVTLVFSLISMMTLVILNMNRERKIKHHHDQIVRVFQALTDVLGRIDESDIDFSEIPFQIEEEPKSGLINKITIDTSNPHGKFNDNTIMLAQYSINKYFPDFQWLSQQKFQDRELIFTGLPKPPAIAKFPGSDYRPTGWIPLGLSGQGEIGWNLADPKEMGISSYINEDGTTVQHVKTPSAPQCLVLGSTGGGKSIYRDQYVTIKDK